MSSRRADKNESGAGSSVAGQRLKTNWAENAAMSEKNGRRKDLRHPFFIP
jgi:hypothetical protein